MVGTARMQLRRSNEHAHRSSGNSDERSDTTSSDRQLRKMGLASSPTDQPGRVFTFWHGNQSDARVSTIAPTTERLNAFMAGD